MNTLGRRHLEGSRASGVTVEVIQEFFHRLCLPAIKGNTASHRYNMDVTGIMEVPGTNGLVIGRAEKTNEMY